METGLTDQAGRRVRLLEPLGKGGFGVVYLAEVFTDSGLASRMAVKLANEALMRQPDMVARARDEARLMSQLNHDHVVRVHSLSELGGRAAVFMEYVEGIDCGRLLLHAYQSSGGGIPPGIAAAIIERAASALHAAWTTISPQTGRPLCVVHRDIKPSNILISRTGAVKVMDFGVARAEFDREARTESVQFGTWRYMAPERILEARAGPESDVFSLGVTLWELLTGTAMERLPPGRDAFHQKHAQHMSRLHVERPLADLVASMLAYEAADRPSAADVEAAIARINLPADLRRYALRTVPPLLDERRQRMAQDEEVIEFTGTIDRLNTPPAETVDGDRQAPTQKNSRTPALVAAAFGMVGVLAVGAAAAWVMTRPSEPEPQPEPEPLAQPEPVEPREEAIEQATQVVQARVDQVRQTDFSACEKDTTEFPTGETEWTLRFNVLLDGSVANEVFQGAEAPVFEQCVLAMLRELQFDAPPAELVIERVYVVEKASSTPARVVVPTPVAAPEPEPQPEEPQPEEPQPTFVPLPVKVKLKSAPAGAKVTVGGQSAMFGQSMNIPPGRHQFLAEWSDGRMTCTMTITPDTQSIKFVKDGEKCLLE